MYHYHLNVRSLDAEYTYMAPENKIGGRRVTCTVIQEYFARDNDNNIVNDLVGRSLYIKQGRLLTKCLYTRPAVFTLPTLVI